MSTAPTTSTLDLPPRLSATAVAEIWRYVALYLFLVFYEFCSSYMLEHFLSQRFGYAHLSYTPERAETYFWICVLTPLAALPAGTRLQTAGQFMFIIFSTLILLTTPLFLVAEVRPMQFWPIYGCIWTATFLLASAARISLQGLARPFTEKNYKIALWGAVAFFAAFFAQGASQNFRFVGFLEIYNARESAEYISNTLVRIVHMYVFSFGGLLACIGLMRKSKLLFIGSLLIFVFCFAISQFKSAILAPAWILYLFMAMRYFCKDSAVRLYAVLTFPFFVGLALTLIFPEVQGFADNYIIFAYFAFISYRFYATSNDAVGLYQDFFSNHPVTHWSHINGVNFFVDYPYAQPLSVVMGDYFGLGDFNASFLATDAIAAYGYQAIPLVALVMAFVYILFNSVTRGIGRIGLAVAVVMPALMFNERPISTSLLTGGIIFLLFFLAWLPASWRNPVK